MQHLTYKELKQRARRLAEWCAAHDESHVHYAAVHDEWKYYENCADEIDCSGVPYAEVDRDECFQKIQNNKI